MVSVKDVAQYFLSKCDEEAGDAISNMKLQKFLYYAQGFHLALFDGQSLFSSPIEAWRHGPVVRTVYAEYADYGAGGIPCPQNFDDSVLPEDVRELLDEVYEVYGQYSAWRLREMTHEEAPWRDHWDPNQPSHEIPHRSMQQFFSTLVH